MKNYTAKQYEMMENKLKNLANGEVFKLNKNDVCPIEVTLNKRRGFKDSWRLQLIDAETDDTLITRRYSHHYHWNRSSRIPQDGGRDAGNDRRLGQSH